MSNPLDSQKTKLLKTKTVDICINNKQFSSNYFKKKAKITISFLLKNPKNNNIIVVNLEMSSSWNFPARASPSYEGAEPSRAELGHFNFRAETELTKF